MDLTFTPDVERAARAAREFVESCLSSADDSGRIAVGRSRRLADLAPLVATSALGRFAALRELGRLPLPWAETFRAAGLPFHDVASVGVEADEGGLVGLALGDPRRRPDPGTLGVRATRQGTWRLHGVAEPPGYLAPVDSLLVGAALSREPQEIGLFLLTEWPPEPIDRVESTGPLHIPLAGVPARLLERGEAAWRQLLALRRQERLSQIALAVGAAMRAHELALAAAREATAAKDPLALGQGVQFQIADNAIDLQVADTLALHCATLAETGALGEADLGSTRFMVIEALERIAARAAHVVGLFATATPPPWMSMLVDLARRLRLEGGAVELDRREAALGLLQTA